MGSLEFGRFSFGIALISLVSLVSDLGISVLMVKEVSKDKKQADDYFTNSLAAKGLLTLAMIGGVILYAQIFTIARELRFVLYILAIAYSIDSITLIYVSIFRAFQQMHFEGAIRVAQGALTLSAGILLLNAGYGIMAMAFNILLASALTLILFAAANRKKSLASLNIYLFSVRRLLALLRSALPYAVLTITVSLYFKIDVVIIELLKGSRQVGYYIASYKLIEAIIVISWIFSRVLLPVLAESFDHSKETLQSIMRSSFRFFAALAVPLAMVVTVMARDIIELLYGSAYNRSVLALQILVWAIVPIFISSTTIVVIMSGKKPQIATYIAVLQLIVNVLLNLLLIPTYGIYGAAVATVATELTNVFLHSIYLRTDFQALKLYTYLARPALGALIMGGAILLWPSLALIPIYFIIYALVLWVIKGLSSADLNLFRRLVLEGK